MSARSSRATERALPVVALAFTAMGACALGACARPGGTGDHAKKDEPLRVAAAADLAVAFREVGTAFEQASGKKVEFSFGSTGLLAKQVTEGAPFDVLAAANVTYVDDVVKAGACNGDTKTNYARGRLVVWAKDASLLPAKLEDLADPKYARVAIANPEHAPYGQAAQQALARAGVWAKAEPRVVYGENVQQTLMFAQSGNADVAVVALSIAMSAGGAFLPIDPTTHAALDQAMVVCKGGPSGGKPNEARAFVAFVGSEAGRAIMRRHGFLLPSESLPSK